MSARGMLGIGVAGAAVLSMLATATKGFSALTTDAARALEVARSPVMVPRAVLIDQHGVAQALNDEQRSTIVDFIYTRFPTMCSELGGVYQQLQSRIKAGGLQSRVRLLSVSFDPSWDTPTRLGRYNLLMRADPGVWTITTPKETGQLPQLLQAFGIRVIDDGASGFVHNAALHVVDPAGRLVAILPIDALEEALGVARSHAKTPVGE